VGREDRCQDRFYSLFNTNSRPPEAIDYILKAFRSQIAKSGMTDLLLIKRTVIEAGTTSILTPINGMRVYQADHSKNSQTAGAVPPAIVFRIPSA
jgi:hypothetical protein